MLLWFGIASLFLLPDVAFASGSYELCRTDVNGGGTLSTGGIYSITASTAQVGGVGLILSSGYEFHDGFWAASSLCGMDCRQNSHCTDGVFCNGSEICLDEGNCVPGVTPCTGGLGCSEPAGSCCTCSVDPDCVCSDGIVCTTDTCESELCTFTEVDCLGACCFENPVDCIDDQDEADCVGFGGEYLGHELTCDGDPDGDGAIGCDDECPRDPLKQTPGECGCGVPEPIICPCGVTDVDNDSDGVPDCFDLCPSTPGGELVGCAGCRLVGACCTPDGQSCFDDIDRDTCEINLSGIYQGNESSCASNCAGAGLGETPLAGDDTCFGGANDGLTCSSHDDCPDGTCISKNRFLSARAGNSGVYTAVRVRLVDLSGFAAFNGEVRWLGAGATYPETIAGDFFLGSALQCAPEVAEWSSLDLVHSFGAEVVPSSLYHIQTISGGCLAEVDDELNYSAPLAITTAKWGDVVVPVGNPTEPTFLDM